MGWAMMILFLTRRFRDYKASVNYMSRAFALALAERGHEVHVVSYNDAGCWFPKPLVSHCVEWKVKERAIGFALDEKTKELVEMEAFDAIVSERHAINPLLQEMAKCPVIGWGLWAVNPQNKSWDAVIAGDDDLLTELAGIAQTKYFMYESPYAHAFHEEAIGAICRTPLDRRTAVVCDGVYMDKLAQREDHEGIQLMVGCALTGFKKVDRVLAAYAQLYKLGIAQRVVLTTPGTAHEIAEVLKKGGIDEGLVECIPECGQERFYQKFAGSDAFLCLVDQETYGAGWIEMVFGGLVGVFLDRPWARLNLPGYPYFARNEEEATAMLAWVCRNIDQARAEVERHMEEWKELHEFGRNAVRMGEFIEEVVR